MLNYNEHQSTNEFLDSLASNSIIPYILQPTSVTSHSKTLIDNIFSNVLSCQQNLETLLQPYLIIFPSFCLLPMCFQILYAIKQAFWKDWSKFNKENFILDYFDKNWPEILELDQHNVNLSMDSYLDHMNTILNFHAPYKKSKYKLILN